MNSFECQDHAQPNIGGPRIDRVFSLNGRFDGSSRAPSTSAMSTHSVGNAFTQLIFDRYNSIQDNNVRLETEHILLNVFADAHRKDQELSRNN